jgi:hypothetical protein
MFHQSDRHGCKHSTLCKVSLDLLQNGNFESYDASKSTFQEYHEKHHNLHSGVLSRIPCSK